MAEISIPIKAEIQEFLDKLGLVKKDINNISTPAKEVEATISKGFNGNNITSTNKELKRTKGLIKDIEDRLKDWEEAKKKATDIVVCIYCFYPVLISSTAYRDSVEHVIYLLR